MKYDLIIIGGGPAGITAGIYASRQKLNTLLITKSFGGQLVNKAVSINNYTGLGEVSGLELIQKFENHLRKQKIDIESDEVTRIRKIEDGFSVETAGKKELKSLSIVIASGADPRPLEVEGEKEFIGKGLSYCVVCDGAFFPDKKVAVIGGGNSSLEAAIFLSQIAEKIYILESSSQIRADKQNQELIGKTGKVELITNAAVKKIIGDKFVSGLVYEDRNSGKQITLPVEGVFVEIGLQPLTSFAKDLVDFNERDEIIIDSDTCQTKNPGRFCGWRLQLNLFQTNNHCRRSRSQSGFVGV